MKKFINIVSFIVLVVLGRLWIEIDQDLLPPHLLFPAFIIVLLVLLIIHFFIVRPVHIWKFARFLALLLLPIVIAMSLYQHMVMQHDFALMWKKSLMICGLSMLLPFAAAFLYLVLVRIKKAVS